MRKVALVLAIVILLSTPLTVQAATPRLISISPELVIDGYMAYLSVGVVGNNGYEDVDATIKLWREDTCIKTWFASGDGYIHWDTTTYVAKGYTYTMTVDATIDGVAMSRVSVSGQS